MTQIRPPHYWFQDDCQNRLCCSFPSFSLQPWNSPLKAPVPWAAIGSWFSDRSPPSALVASLRNKAIFPSYQHLSLGNWLSSGEQLDLGLVTESVLAVERNLDRYMLNKRRLFQSCVFHLSLWNLCFLLNINLSCLSTDYQIWPIFLEIKSWLIKV